MAGNYSRSIYKQLEESLLKIDLLEEENKTLKDKIIFMAENHAKEIKALNAKIVTFEKENQKLREIINKDSHNSSKPPSSDGFKKMENNTREQSARVVGGQKGHVGNVPVLYKSPTKVIEHKKEYCECGAQVIYTGAYKAKQKADIT